MAEYTAKKLPAFIKQNKDYQAGNIHKVIFKRRLGRTILKLRPDLIMTYITFGFIH